MKNLLWASLLALTACSPDVRRFVPPSADMTQMAHLIALSDPSEAFLQRVGHYLFITSVDGKPSKNDWEVRALPSDVYLTSGTHRFRVLYRHAGLIASAHLEIDAKAGATYYIHRHPDAYGVRFWLTEGKQDGPKVGRSRQAKRNPQHELHNRGAARRAFARFVAAGKRCQATSKRRPYHLARPLRP
jgi:hypothetical protein